MVSQTEKKYMMALFPRAGNVGVAPATNSTTYVFVGDLAAGNAMIFVQADGADLYFACGPINGFPFNPGATGQPNYQGTPGGSVQTAPGQPGTCAILQAAQPPQRFMLEPPAPAAIIGQGTAPQPFLGDNWIAFTLYNPNFSNPAYFRWWRSSLLSTGGQG
jgi:hypothetical protein